MFAGSHYKVVLKDGKRTCACIDHRIRKHDCKHIRLLLKSLSIEEHPEKWRDATKRSVCKQAGVKTEST
jgi:hypothetical protein